ncbi:PRC-barrel domain-containing protein [Rhizorhapis sp. SPR117]|uniref:PRC-barrel domain-containing protein n=1 Tax=Rhizorhapis sp. SPR117 TaxID=2912611 RepID=UPI001F24C13C|nr:PRC-barrel domain-containing protein [Rhizorhapis sp. SPR117]
MRADILIGSEIRKLKDERLGEISDIVLNPEQRDILHILVSPAVASSASATSSSPSAGAISAPLRITNSTCSTSRRKPWTSRGPSTAGTLRQRQAVNSNARWTNIGTAS